MTELYAVRENGIYGAPNEQAFYAASDVASLALITFRRASVFTRELPCRLSPQIRSSKRHDQRYGPIDPVLGPFLLRVDVVL